MPRLTKMGPSNERPDRDQPRPTDLEAMRYRGNPGMNDTFLGYLGSALGKGETVINAIETKGAGGDLPPQ